MKSAYVLFHATHVGSLLTGGVRHMLRIKRDKGDNANVWHVHIHIVYEKLFQFSLLILSS